MFKFKFEKKTKEQKEMEKQGKKLEKEYKKKFGHCIITKIIAFILILAMLIPTVIGIIPYLIH